MAHLDGDEQHLVQRKEHRNLQQHRKTASRRIDLLFLVESHHRLVHRHPVIGMTLADFLNLW